LPVFAQVPAGTHIAILKAEDARDYNALKPFIFSKDLKIQARAVLAAGRIGEPSSVDALAGLLENGDMSIRPIAAFALGETEAEHAAVFILRSLADPKTTDAVRARAVEAAGKIAAANAKDNDFKALGTAILGVLNAEDRRGKNQDRETVLLALTAALRTRPEGADVVTAKFLTNAEAAIRTSAGNTMARLRGKNANATLRTMLVSDIDPSARANAARALGAAEDKESVDLLLKAAVNDGDSRVRVSAIRSLAALKDAKSADPLLKRGEDLLALYSKAKKPNFIPVEQNEFIEIATALGRVLANTDNPRADKLFADFGKLDKGHTPEVYIARVRVGPKRGDGSSPELISWRQYSSMAQIIGEFADIEPTSQVGKEMKAEAPGIIRPLAKAFAEADPATEGKRMMAGPDVLQAFARFKTDDLAEILRTALKNKDMQMRATAAGLLAEIPQPIENPTKVPDPKQSGELLYLASENLDALRGALEYARVNDIESNDAILATIDALAKLDPAGLRWRFEMLSAVRSPDYLVRKKTMDLIPNIPLVWESFPFDSLHGSPGNVRPYSGKGTKIGQVLNKDSDYRRAVKRKNGSVKAVFTTEKGTFAIELLPEDAPLTVDNFVKLANAKYFNGLEVHRVVPNFVMQDGDPRGDGNGGPGWSIRCEINMVPFDRGTVGMALSGKDTGGSQWFVTHAAQPHLDGGYTVFGRVTASGMKVVDNIVRGDKILTVRIVEGGSPQRAQRTQR
jgi:cyclophilin family peptidyl-prolyl cis-trans isomerase/HEAT repeat protein